MYSFIKTYLSIVVCHLFLWKKRLLFVLLSSSSTYIQSNADSIDFSSINDICIYSHSIFHFISFHFTYFCYKTKEEEEEEEEEEEDIIL